jgi:hypothetical protein
MCLGAQGLDWFQAGLKQDRDGDTAHQFLVESPPRPPGKKHKQQKGLLVGAPAA